MQDGKGRLYRRKDGKYLIYLPMTFATDSMFPFPLNTNSDIYVKIHFDDKKRLIVQKWEK